MERKKRHGINSSSLSNRVLYSIVSILLLMVVAVGVYAYGTSSPSSFGHSAGEVEGTVPSGGIVMFAGNCPSGWTEYTALRGRFPRGEPSGNVGSLDTGGSDDAVVVAHTHTIDPPATSTSTAGAHTHTSPIHVFAGGTVGGFGAVITGGSTTTSSAGSHSHTVDIAPFTSGSTGVSGVGANVPKYKEVIFCMKN